MGAGIGEIANKRPVEAKSWFIRGRMKWRIFWLDRGKEKRCENTVLRKETEM